MENFNPNELSPEVLQGIDPVELKKLKALLNFGKSKPTKKFKTKAERIARRKIQKNSRRVNRGTNKGKRPKKSNTHRVGFG